MVGRFSISFWDGLFSEAFAGGSFTQHGSANHVILQRKCQMLVLVCHHQNATDVLPPWTRILRVESKIICNNCPQAVWNEFPTNYWPSNVTWMFEVRFFAENVLPGSFLKKNNRPFSCWCWSHPVSLRIRQWDLKCEMSLWQMPWCVVTDIYHVYTQAVVLHVWQDGLLRWVWPPPSNSGQWTFRLDLFSTVMSSWWSLLLRGGQIHDIFTKHFRYLR